MIFEKKYNALDSFYNWVSQGNEYNTAVEQVFYYDRMNLDELDNIVYSTTILSQYERLGKIISDNFKERLENAILDYNKINLSRYELNEGETEQLLKDITLAKKYLEWMNKQKSL